MTLARIARKRHPRENEPKAKFRGTAKGGSIFGFYRGR
jgi:hypothetical protein